MLGRVPGKRGLLGAVLRAAAFYGKAEKRHCSQQSPFPGTLPSTRPALLGVWAFSVLQEAAVIPSQEFVFVLHAVLVQTPPSKRRLLGHLPLQNRGKEAPEFQKGRPRACSAEDYFLEVYFEERADCLETFGSLETKGIQKLRKPKEHAVPVSVAERGSSEKMMIWLGCTVRCFSRSALPIALQKSLFAGFGVVSGRHNSTIGGLP